MQSRLRLRDGHHVRRLIMAFFAAMAVLGAGVVPASAQDTESRSAKVVFAQLNDSGIEGSASLRRRGDRTDVEIRTDGALGNHPTHIHQGTCDDLDPNPEFPLVNVQLRTAGLTGISDTVVDVPLSELLDEPHLILIHKSEKDIGTYFACGDIVAGRLAASEQVGGDRTGSLPKSGTGSGIESGTSISTISGALGAAVAAFVIAISLALLRSTPPVPPAGTRPARRR